MYLQNKGVRDLKGYNALAEKEGIGTLPQIVIIIDELGRFNDGCSKRS